jgi:hypothetical protein
MAKILFRLRNVPEDEAAEVRELLELNGIDFYETSAGSWGISMPAIWVRDENQLDEARSLLQTYQQNRSERIRREFAELRASGQAPTLLDSFRAQPLRFILFAAVALLIVYVSISAFY